METVIQIEDLAVAYGRPVPEQVQALQEVSLKVHKGEIFGLLGPNGAGKTILLSVLQGLIKPQSGRALIYDLDVTRSPARTRQLLGSQLQQTTLIDDLTVQYCNRRDLIQDRLSTSFLISIT